MFNNKVLKVTQNRIQVEHIFIYKLSRVSSHAVCSARENSFPLILQRNALGVQECEAQSDGRDEVVWKTHLDKKGICGYSVLESTRWFSNCKRKEIFLFVEQMY